MSTDKVNADADMARRTILRIGTAIGIAGLTLTLTPHALADVRARRQAAPARLPVVVIDPGHGGVDPGCIGYSGTYEKQITWASAQLLAQKLEASGKYTIFLTRAHDEYVPLTERVARARAAKGDLFISMHADAIPDENVRGASVFTLSDKASDAMAAAIADRENRADESGGLRFHASSPEVTSILLDLARRHTNNLSQGLARSVVTKLGSEVRMLDHSHRSAGFAVLKAPDIPSVLIEMGCLSNPVEDRLLNTKAYRDKITTSIVAAVGGYMDGVGRA